MFINYDLEIFENVSCTAIKGWSEVVYCILNMSLERFTNYVVICAILIDLKSASGVHVTRATDRRPR